MSLVGIVLILGVCILLSRDWSRIQWRTVAWGLALQFIFGLLVLKTYPEAIFAGAQGLFDGISEFAGAGSAFLFGALADKQDFVILNMASVIIFVSSVMAVLNFLRILPAIMYALARAMQWTMRTSGAETLAAVVFILMGIEGITALKSVIRRLTSSELFSVMCCFMATIAGSVMAVYVGVFGASAGHVLAASVMSAPAALALSKIVMPETGTPETGGRVDWELLLPEDRSVVEAAANGAVDGLRLAATIGAILLAFVAIIHMLDAFLGLAGTSFGEIGSYVFAPVALVLGVPWEDCLKAGNLLAVKTVFNEWLAYSQMQTMVAAGDLSPRAVMIVTYALCSFANFGSLGILIGAVTALAPERREEAASLGLWALLTGLLAGFLTAAIAGTLGDPS
jgi:CNT family concentrative nucleoside transporter